MEDYLITVPEIHNTIYKLKAESKEEAVRKILYEPITEDIEIITDSFPRKTREENWEVRTQKEYDDFYASQYDFYIAKQT
jgi:hypothetical protein